MKKIKRFIAVLFIIVQSGIANSQTTIYADTVMGFSSEYSGTIWSAAQILGIPNAYPNCGDIPTAWTFYSHPREWIEIGYLTHLYVDTIKIYETNHSGAIDTVYLRDAGTGNWNTIYSSTTDLVDSCRILEIVIPTTTYKVDAIRIAIGDYIATGLYYPEYDAVALIGSTTLSSINKTVSDSFVISNLNDGSIFINSKNTNELIKNIYLSDVMGRQIGSYNVNNNSYNINTSNYKTGIYFINIILENGKVLNHKVFITK